MTPLNVVVWTCVAVFVVTAILSILQLCGIKVIPNPENERTLFRVLVVEIVVVAVAAFAASLNPEPDMEYLDGITLELDGLSAQRESQETSIEPEERGSREERRERQVNFSEKNGHCDKDRVFSIRVEADSDDGWSINVASISPDAKTSSESSFSGIRDMSTKGFAIEGVVRNRGRCVFGAGDARGHVWGNVTFEEFRTVP